MSVVEASIPSGMPRIGRPLGQDHSPRLSAGWPLTALLLLYPLWWALGMGTLIVYLLAAVMGAQLLRRRQILVPPGFWLWALFLLWVVFSTAMLGESPPGTLPDSVSGRVVSAAFNFAGYLSATVVLLYAGNLSEEEFPRARLVRQLGVLFIMVVAGGMLGTFAPHFEFTSPVEVLLPNRIAGNLFVQSLVHPSSAQLQDVLGYTSPRPSAPFGFTNTWGNCLALLLGWFAIAWLPRGRKHTRLVGLVVLTLAAIPIATSLNRGLWLALGLIIVIMAFRLALRGHTVALRALLVAVVVAIGIVLATPLSSVVSQRLDNQHSNAIRAFTTERTLETIGYSPVMGFGTTRAVLGSANSIAVGITPSCPRCGNPKLGSNGQLWLLLIAHGIVGAMLYVAFLVRTLWAFRHDRSAIGDAGLLAIALSLFFLFIYNAVTMPLVLAFISVALLWRNHRDSPSAAAAGPPRLPLPLPYSRTISRARSRTS